MPSPSLARRSFLFLVGAATVVGPRRSASALAATAPWSPSRARTIDEVLARLRAILAPGVLADLASVPESSLVEYCGVDDLLQRCWGWPLTLHPAVTSELRERGVVAGDDLIGYWLTTIARQERGFALDTAEQLKPFREAQQREAREELARQEWRRTHPDAPVVHYETLCKLNIRDQFYFAPNESRLRPDQDELLTAMVSFLRSFRESSLVQACGHASPSERGVRALSVARADTVRAALVARGVPAARLAAHGLGADYLLASGVSKRARCVDLVILRS